jgi:hypothetical protein
MITTQTFLGIDEGSHQLFKGDTGSSDLHWIQPIPNLPQARDIHRLDHDRCLIGYDRGFFICEIATGKILEDCSKWEKVTSVVPQPNGYFLVTGLNLAGHDGVTVLLIDETYRVADSWSRPGDYVRLMRPSTHQTYYFCVNDHILETDLNLDTLTTFASPGFLHAWKPHQLPSGDLLVSGGYGAFMARFSAQGQEIQTFGRVDQVPQEIQPNFYANFDLDSQGNIYVANWQGHGPDNGSKGRQLLCFSPAGEFMDSWSYGKNISSFQGVLLVT